MNVHIPTPLRSYTQQSVVPGNGATLDQVLLDLERRFPGFRFRVVNEQGELREHLKIFVNQRIAQSLNEPVAPNDEVRIIAAISGGSSPMIIDAHTHIFSPDVITHRAQYAERDAFFGFLYSGLVARLVGADEIIAAMDAAGIDQAVLTGWCWQHHELGVEQNSWMMDVVRQYPGRLIALAAIQPNAGTAAMRELERCIAGGMVGLGELNADGQSFRLDDANVLALANAAAEMNVPFLLHTNEPIGHQYPGKGQLPLADIYDFIKAVPKLKLVLAHWGGGFPFYELMREVRKIAVNVYYDSAASPLLYSSKIFRTVIDIVGSDQVMFGSDFPLILYPKRQSEPDFSPFLTEIRNLGLSDEEWANVMYKNAHRVYLQKRP